MQARPPGALACNSALCTAPSARPSHQPLPRPDPPRGERGPRRRSSTHARPQAEHAHAARTPTCSTQRAGQLGQADRSPPRQSRDPARPRARLPPRSEPRPLTAARRLRRRPRTLDEATAAADVGGRCALHRVLGRGPDCTCTRCTRPAPRPPCIPPSLPPTPPRPRPLRRCLTGCLLRFGSSLRSAAAC